MKTASCKNKGRQLQKYVAKTIREFLGLPEEDVVSRPMGSAGCDIMLSHLALFHLPLEIECKNTKKFPSLAALEQSKDRNNSNWKTSCVVWKPPGKPLDDSIIYFNLKDFLELWKETK